MSDQNNKRDDEKARSEALFRYRVLVPLLEEHPSQSLRERVGKRAAQRHEHPRLRETAREAITGWVHAFGLVEVDRRGKEAGA